MQIRGEIVPSLDPRAADPPLVARKLDRYEDKFVANRVNCARKRFLRRNRCERLAEKFLRERSYRTRKLENR